MTKLEIYEERVLEENGQSHTWVRKERLEELQRCFDAICDGHARFINLVHDALLQGESKQCH
jgi:hypothetical protein